MIHRYHVESYDNNVKHFHSLDADVKHNTVLLLPLITAGFAQHKHISVLRPPCKVCLEQAACVKVLRHWQGTISWPYWEATYARCDATLLLLPWWLVRLS